MESCSSSIPPSSSGCSEDYLKECRKCRLLRFSFSGLWDAMWENSLKMSRYVASPDEENKQTKRQWNSQLALSESQHLLYEEYRQRRKHSRGGSWMKAPESLRSFPPFQLSKHWAFTFSVVMVTSESAATTKAAELFCVRESSQSRLIKKGMDIPGFPCLRLRVSDKEFTSSLRCATFSLTPTVCR